MECRINEVLVHDIEHGIGVPLVGLHGAGVDHREIEAAIEAIAPNVGYRRIYPDLPGLRRAHTGYRSPLPRPCGARLDPRGRGGTGAHLRRVKALAVIDDAGHAVMHERPELLAALFGDWLDRTRLLEQRSSPT